VQYIHSSAYILAVILLFAILSCLEVIAENETLKKKSSIASFVYCMPLFCVWLHFQIPFYNVLIL